MATSLQERYPDAHIWKDILERPKSDEMPPLIRGYRPDIFWLQKNRPFIGEVKTYEDIQKRRSYLQIKTFLKHVERHSGYFAVGIYGQGANYAKTLLSQFINKYKITSCQLEVYDGLDYWEYKSNSKKSWHLI